MANNAFLVFLILGAVSLGALGGYFVFLGMYQERFTQQDRITLENFDVTTVVFSGAISSISENEVAIEREGTQFPLKITEGTTFFVPEEVVGVEAEIARKTRRFPIQKGSLADLRIGEIASVVALFSDKTFQAIDITIISP